MLGMSGTRRDQVTIAEQKIRNNRTKMYSDSIDRFMGTYENYNRRLKDIFEKRKAYHEFCDEHTHILEDAYNKVKTSGGVSVLACAAYKKKRDEMLERFRTMGEVDSVEVFETLSDLSMLAKSIQKEDAQIMLADVVYDYNLDEARRKGTKKSFSDLKAEIDFSSHKRIYEGATGKAVLTALAIKMRNKIKHSKNDADKFKALADLIVLAALFNHDTVKELMKQLSQQ